MWFSLSKSCSPYGKCLTTTLTAVASGARLGFAKRLVAFLTQSNTYTVITTQRLWTWWLFFCVQIIREPEKFLLNSQVTLSGRVFIAKEAFEERKLSVACLYLIPIPPSQPRSWSTRLFLYTGGNTIIWTGRILTKINLNAVSSTRHS